MGDINEQVHYWEAKLLILKDDDLYDNTEQARSDPNKGYAKYTR